MFLFIRKKDRLTAQNITASGATSVGLCRAILIQVNAALTGNIVVSTAGSSQYGTTGATIATITNPTVGSQFRYGGLQNQGAVSITPSTTTDISVTKLNNA